jgi:hypothetical protein
MGENYLVNAAFLAERAKTIEGNRPKDWPLIYESLVTSSIFSSCFSLEATINGCFFEWADMGEAFKSGDKKRISSLWSLNIPRTANYGILEKYEIALALFGKGEFAKGSNPYQDAKLLVQLRNALVHYEPSWEPVAQREKDDDVTIHKLTRSLRGKFSENPLCARSAPFWPIRCLGSGCAHWAVDTSSIAVTDTAFIG